MQMYKLELPEGVLHNILAVFKSSTGFSWEVSNPVIMSIQGQMDMQREQAKKQAAALEALKNKAANAPASKSAPTVDPSASRE